MRNEDPQRGAVAQNPKNLGIGIDENTAIFVEDERTFRVIGSGGVYVMDGTHISYSSLADKKPEGVLSILNNVLHVLSDGDEFDLINRYAIPPKLENGDRILPRLGVVKHYKMQRNHRSPRARSLTAGKT